MASMDLSSHLLLRRTSSNSQSQLIRKPSVFNGSILRSVFISSSPYPFHKLQHHQLSLSKHISIIRASPDEANEHTSLPLTSELPIGNKQTPVTTTTTKNEQSDYYTSMKDDHLDFWDEHIGVRKIGEFGKGWINEAGEEDPLLLAHLHLLSNMAADRAEMHFIISQQRDNWNKLFQSSIVTITMTSTLLAAMSTTNTYDHNIAFSLLACIMDTIVGGMMIGINKFQPSQLSEEQRTATRLCRKLRNDIDFVLKINPNLRQDADSFVEEVVSRLLAVDAAYPLPLTPMKIPKFPKEIKAPTLSKHVEMEQNEIHELGNGWTPDMSYNLAKLAELMHKSDTNDYLRMAKRVQKLNKVCSIGAPMFAILGALLNGFAVAHGVGAIDFSGVLDLVNIEVLAAVASTIASFASSFSHDAQLGMIFELYRSSMGYFGDVEASIHRAIRMPISKREHGAIFNQRVAYELGRKLEDIPNIVSDSKTASSLF